MPGPGMELIGEEEIQEVLGVLRSGYLYRYDVAPGKTNFQGKVMAQTDELLSRAINISIGVPDPGLGSAFGLTIHDGPAAVKERAAEFRRVAGEYLQ